MMPLNNNQSYGSGINEGTSSSSALVQKIMGRQDRESKSLDRASGARSKRFGTGVTTSQKNSIGQIQYGGDSCLDEQYLQNARTYSQLPPDENDQASTFDSQLAPTDTASARPTEEMIN